MPGNISNIKSVALEKLATSYNSVADSDLPFQLKAEMASREKILTEWKEMVNSKYY